MPTSRGFGLSSSSTASSRHANRARAASDDEQSSDGRAADDSYRRTKKSSSSLKTSSSSRSHKRPVDEEDFDHIRPVKKSSQKPTTAISSARHNDAASDVDDDNTAESFSEAQLLERKAYDEWVDKKLSKLTTKREQMLEDRLERLRSERDDIQAQYDELRQLRDTAPEAALEEFKKVAEARYRHDKDLISSLKAKVEAAEKRAKESENGAAAGGDRSISILNASVRESVAPEISDAKLDEMERQHKKELADAARTQKRLEEDVKMYKLQLEQEVAQSKALLAAASAAPASSSSSSASKPVSAASAGSASLAAMEDEKSIRKLYEDLTGLVVTSVERIDPSHPQRRFKAIFAQEDYYSVLMDLEESSSKVQTSSGKERLRDDIVYVPKLDDDRDSELLASDMVPQEWLDALRFDRGMLFKWYEKTRKALLTDEARRKLRAREERNRS